MIKKDTDNLYCANYTKVLLLVFAILLILFVGIMITVGMWLAAGQNLGSAGCGSIG